MPYKAGLCPTKAHGPIRSVIVWNTVAFAIAAFLSLRPYAYHLTSVDNLPSIRATGRLESAATLIDMAGRLELSRQRRQRPVRIRVSGADVWLQGQGPLHEGNISFGDGWGLEDLVERLNDLVFFWPGRVDRPNKYGMRHFESTSWCESPALLRVDTAALLKENPTLTPLYCCFNSGSPRCVDGRKSPRGPDTFLPADQFARRCSEVAELTFPRGVSLPNCTECGFTPRALGVDYLSLRRDSNRSSIVRPADGRVVRLPRRNPGRRPRPAEYAHTPTRRFSGVFDLR